MRHSQIHLDSEVYWDAFARIGGIQCDAVHVRLGTYITLSSLLCFASCRLDDAVVRATADALVSTGLAAKGYKVSIHVSDTPRAVALPNPPTLGPCHIELLTLVIGVV